MAGGRAWLCSRAVGMRLKRSCQNGHARLTNRITLLLWSMCHVYHSEAQSMPKTLAEPLFPPASSATFRTFLTVLFPPLFSYGFCPFTKREFNAERRVV